MFCFVYTFDKFLTPESKLQKNIFTDVVSIVIFVIKFLYKYTVLCKINDINYITNILWTDVI